MRGFSMDLHPVKNPDMWSAQLFKRLADLSHQGTSIATFTAASRVRKGLIEAGFEIKKVTGYGRKREMLAGYFRQTQNKYQTKAQEAHLKTCTPWLYNEHHKILRANNPHEPIAIIGAGLAACHTAHLLANRGYTVHLFDRHKKIAQGASGNLQGILYAKLSHRRETLGEFNLHSLLYAQTFYQTFWQAHQQHKSFYGEACGVEQREHKAYLAILDNFTHCEWLQTNKDALYFPYCGWLNPAALCEWLINNERIHHFQQTEIQQLQYNDKHWSLSSGSQEETASYQAVIICNAYEAKQFQQTQWLPLKSIRGQVSHIESATLNALNHVICADAYVAPAHTDLTTQKKQHCIGASFNLHNNSTALHDEDHHDNIQKLQQQVGSIDYQLCGGRVSFRCTSPDYLH